MNILSQHEICPRPYEYCWSDSVLGLKDLASEKDIKENRKIRGHLNPSMMYEGVGFIFMEKVEDVASAKCNEVFLQKLALAYGLGFICPEPDLVLGRSPEGTMIYRILDWGNWDDEYVCNFESFMQVVKHIKRL